MLVEEGERAALSFQLPDFEIVQQHQVRDPGSANRVGSKTALKAPKFGFRYPR